MGSNQSNSNNKQQQEQPQQQQQQQQIPQMQQKRIQTKKVPSKLSNKKDQLSPRLKPLQDKLIFDDDEPIEQNQKPLENLPDHEKQQQKEENQEENQQQQEESKENVKNVQNVQNGQNSSLQKKKIDFDLEKNLIFSLKSMTKAIKLSENNVQTIPAMVSLETAKEAQQLDLNQRPSLDLVCVIDRSGSMSGNKIQQVKEALHCLIELLNDKDRIMLVQFDHQAQRILPFTRVSPQNLNKIKTAIDSIRAAGGTKIKLGMELALKGIRERKYQNPVTSVFLLSDGQDSYDSVEFLKQQALKNEFVYSINSFGFGGDHDPNLMNQICQVQDGNFYYVEQIDTVDEMFIDALGGLFSVIAQNVKITVSLKKEHKLFGDVSVSKTYGDMWKYDEKSNSYSISILQLISGVSKEFLLEIELPPITQKLQDFERNAQLLTAQIEMFANSDDQKQNPIVKNANLEMTFYNADEEIPGEALQQNDDVELNYLRVRGADVIQQCMQKAEQGQYEEGQKLIKNIQVDIDKARPENRKKLQMLYNDLQESEQTCNKDRYQQEGKFRMITQNKAHMEKRSRNLKSKKAANFSEMPQQMDQMRLDSEEEQQDMYQNCVQQQMVFSRVQKKKQK